MSWDDIFICIGPILMNELTEVDLKKSLTHFTGFAYSDEKYKYFRDSALNPDSFSGVIVQLRALGLVDKGIRKRAVSDRGKYWVLTEKGERYLVGLLAQKKVEAIKIFSNSGEIA